MTKFKCPVHGEIIPREVYKIKLDSYISQRLCVRCIMDYLKDKLPAIIVEETTNE